MCKVVKCFCFVYLLCILNGVCYWWFDKIVLIVLGWLGWFDRFFVDN